MENNNSPSNSYLHILNSQVLISNTQNSGLNSDCDAVTQLEQMLRIAIEEEKPVSHYLSSSCFDLSVLKIALGSLLSDLSNDEWLKEVNTEQFEEDINHILPELLDGSLSNNLNTLQIQSQVTGISLEFLSMIGGVLIQPAMRFIGQSSPKNLLDAWELTPCPICGRMPSVVIKPEDDSWMFKCSFCRTKYRMNIFVCPYCKTDGSETKEFHLIGENHEYEIAECKECGHYYKIINISRLKEMIPEGLEDTYTRLLDTIAADYKLTRLDE